MNLKWMSAPIAILIGSVIVSTSILVSGGVISLKTPAKQAQGDQVAPVAQAPQQPQAKTPEIMVNNLKSYAKQAGLDQGKFDKCLDSGEKAKVVTDDASDAQTLGVGGTPSFFINGRALFIGAAPFEQFKKVIDEELNGTAGTVERKTVKVGDLPALGKENAPVTLIEFSDFQCPFCGRFYSGAEAQIKKEYVETGKVKIYYRDFPLIQIHPGAQKGAEAGRCANDQGKFWQYHDLIFANQDKIF